MKFVFRCGLIVASALATLNVWAQTFTETDLKAMVKQLETYSPRFKDYVYPIKASIVKSDEINAYATIEKDKNGKLQAVMVVYTAFVDFVKADKRLIRACIAHEISHLSKGHCSMPGYKPSDLDNLWTRQQEYEADITGASLLQKAGFSKNDMVDLMVKLDDLNDGPWLGRLSADHASGKSRAAEIADNPTVLRSLMDFEVGLAFMECRSYRQSMDAFDRAIQKEPKLKEAYTNSAQSALMFYYDNLPLSVQLNWLRPDFGPMLAPPVKSRGVELTDDDRKRWEAARSRIAAALAQDKSDSRNLELASLILVLDPDGKSDNLKAGTDGLQALLKASIVPGDKLRLANNAALGLQRLGKLSDGMSLLIEAQKGTTIYNPFLAENLGVNGVPKGDKQQAELAANVLATWLTNTAPSHPEYEKIKAAYSKICADNSFKVLTFKDQPIFLCQVMSVNNQGKDLGMFDPFEKFVEALGEPEGALKYNERYPDLMEVRWNGGQFSVLTERDQILRVTSYAPGAYIRLRPQDATLTFDFKATVGMTKAEFSKVLNPDKAEKKNLVKAGAMEEWNYWPGLGFGVLFKDDKIVGITATPSR